MKEDELKIDGYKKSGSMITKIFTKIFRWIRINKIKKHIKRGSIVCDIGCGFNGTFLKEIRSRIKKGIGFDRRVYSSKDPKIELKEVKADKYPLSKNSVDIVTLLAVLEHLDNPKIILKEAYGILKPGGTILITTPTPKGRIILEFLAFKLKLVNKEGALDHKIYFTHNQLDNLLKECGFKEIKLKTFEFGLNRFVIAKK